MTARTLSAQYTQADHEKREQDPYALSKYEITLRWIGDTLRSGSTLLNIGCGGGFFHQMLPRNGAKVVACEPDRLSYGLAAARNPDPSRVEIHHCGLFELKEKSLTGDVIVMHDVLEHIEDEAAAVGALASLVKPGSLLVLSVPALNALFGHHDVQLGHFRRYTKSSLRRALEPHFEITRLRYFGFSFIPLVLWFSVWRKKAYPLGAGGRRSLAGRAFKLLCRIEARLPLPIGTSLICELRPRGGGAS